MGKSEQQQIRQLRAKVRELEQTVAAQKKIVEIMKSLPGVREVKPKDGNAKSGVHRRTQTRSGAVAEDGSTRESKANGRDLGGDDKDSKIVGEKLQ